MASTLIDFSNSLAQIADRVAGSAVAVHTEARGSSSGVVWRKGIVITAEHALRRDEEIAITLPTGTVAPATLLGRDASLDLAVLECKDATAAPSERGEVAALKPGALALSLPPFWGSWEPPFAPRPFPWASDMASCRSKAARLRRRLPVLDFPANVLRKPGRGSRFFV